MMRLLKVFLISSLLFGCGFTPTQQYPGPCSHNTVHEFVFDSQVHSSTDEWFYTYDEKHNLILEERVVGGRVVDSLARYYEQDNRLVSTVDEEGHEILLYYDEDGKLTHTHQPSQNDALDGFVVVTEFEYDANGFLVLRRRLDNYVYTTSYTNNAIGNPVFATTVDESGQLLENRSWYYNSIGELRMLTVDFGIDSTISHNETYTYDSFGNLTQSRLENSHGAEVYTIESKTYYYDCRSSADFS